MPLKMRIAIVCVSVLEHVPLEQRAAWFDKLYRLLKPGGAAVLTFEWHPTTVFDIGDGHTLTTPQLVELYAATTLRAVAQIASPVRAANSRGWLPLAVKFIRE